MVGVVLVFITSFITTAYGPVVRRQIKEKGTSKWQLIVAYLV
jgi:hypothetical protein